MPKVEPVHVLNIDGQAFSVDAMSDAVKQMVAVFNEWAQDEADARTRLMQVQAAKNDLSRQIIIQIRQEQQAAEQAAPVDAPAPAAVQTTEAPAPAVEPAPEPVVEGTEPVVDLSDPTED